MTYSPKSRYHPWDVVLVPFPYSEQSAASKVRPAVVVCAARLPQKTRMYYVAMVTNAEHRPWDGDVPVSDLKLAGLPIPSIVRSAKLATIDQTAILRAVGILPNRDRSQVADAIQAFLANA
jgi:mRNA-degrading endonuclease toxin of MazEF toxin-antitoxin module